MSQTTLANIKEKLSPARQSEVAVNMETVAGFESMQRIAKLFASSSITPLQYRGENGFSNCFIAIDMAMRMNANPLMVMQNLYIVHGNPAWSAQFLIATFNKCGRFSALRYEFQGKEGQDDWGCRAVSTELSTGERLVGPLITIDMAKKSGWYSKKDKQGNESSKWQSMPEQMLRYRAAAWFVRVYAPEIAMGLQTTDEVHDSIIDVTPEDYPNVEIVSAEPESAKQAADKKRAAKAQKATHEQNDPETAEDTETETRPENSAPQKSGFATIICPKPAQDGSQRMVEEDDCHDCADRKDCPAWDNI